MLIKTYRIIVCFSFPVPQKKEDERDHFHLSKTIKKEYKRYTILYFSRCVHVYLIGKHSDLTHFEIMCF